MIALVHPIQTYFVAYIWQRMGLLCCFFYLSALAVYLVFKFSGWPALTAVGFLVAPRSCPPTIQQSKRQHSKAAHSRYHYGDNYHDAIIRSGFLFFCLLSLE
jgi:hypothetical protein